MRRRLIYPKAYVLVLAVLALVSVLVSEPPEGVTVTAWDIVMSTVGWTLHLIVISTPSWLGAVVIFIIWWRRRT